MAQDSFSSLITYLKNEKEGTEYSKALKPFQRAARWIPIAISPFVNINTALYAGIAMINKSELPPNGKEEDMSNFEMLSNICPGLKEVLEAFNGDTALVKCFINHLSTAAGNSRADDSSSCRKATPGYVLALNHDIADNINKKSNRGWNNLYTACLLCPLKYLPEFDEDPELFMGKVLNRTIKLKASQWPSFLYPKGTVYNRECIDDGLFRGEIMMLFLRNICTGPTSAQDGIRKASKPSKAEIHGMDRVFGRCVAYVAVQAYFALSAIEHWSSSPQEGYFDLVDFFGCCVDLFESDPADPWVEETLDCLTGELPSLKREYKQKQKRNISSTFSDESDEDEAQAIYTQRKARRLEHIASNISTNGTQSNADTDSNSGTGKGTTSSTSSVSSPRQTQVRLQTAIRPVMSMSDLSDLSEEDETPPSPNLHRRKTEKKKKIGRALHV